MSWLAGKKHEANWRTACRKAAENADAFSSFRSDPGIAAVAETTPGWKGLVWWGVIETLWPTWATMHIDAIAKLDETGGPPVTVNCGGRDVSPTTLRNLYRMLEIGMYLYGTHILEIGGGYGALAKLACKCACPHTYTLYDGVEEAVSLQREYLKGHHNVVCTSSMSCLDRPYDVVISDYAIGELDRDEATAIAKRVFPGCNRGYLAWPDTGGIRRCEAAAWLCDILGPRRWVSTGTFDVVKDKLKDDYEARLRWRSAT